MSGTFRFPSDDEFKQALHPNDVYHLRICKYLLGKLENYRREQRYITLIDYTMEHVIPQELSRTTARRVR